MNFTIDLFSFCAGTTFGVIATWCVVLFLALRGY